MQVAPGGAAELAGLTGAKSLAGAVELGDVIVGIDNIEIHKSADLFKALDTHKVGDQVEITVENDHKRRTVKVTLQPIP
jgi:S1-C subfamily serine protease